MARKKRKQAAAKPQRMAIPKGIANKIIQKAVRGYGNQERHSQLSEAAKLALDERIKEVAADSDMLWPPDEHKERGTPDIVKQMDKIVGISPEDRELMNSGSHGFDSETNEVRPWQKTPMEGMFVTDPEGLVPEDLLEDQLRRGFLTSPDTEEGTDGSTRDLTRIKEFTTEYPIGSMYVNPDEPSYHYTVQPDRVGTGGRFLEDIFTHAASARGSLSHLHTNARSTLTQHNTGFEYMKRPFQELPPEEQRHYKGMWEFWVKLGKQLTEPGLFKRLIMDGNQAQQFANAPTGPDIERQTLLHPPFRNFYMEFTKPISVGEQEPLPDGRTTNDEVVALTYRAKNPDHWFDHTGGVGTRPPPRPDVMVGDFEVGQLSILLRDKGDTSITDRNFVICLSTGNATTRWLTATEDTLDPSVFPDAYWNAPRLTHQRGSPLASRWIEVATGNPATNLAPSNIPGRHVGYWERIVNKYADWFSWLMLYTIAKGIEIVEEPLPRHERRRMERQARKGIVPEPWQIVRVEPTLRKKYEKAGASSAGPKVTHGYRYDVRGHLRNGKHKLRDGSYKYTVEWVPDHQRGLKNELYIPKTHAYEGDMDDKLIPTPQGE